MKPARKTDSTSQSCSCTSCMYKSESDQVSVRKYLAHGSRLERLYFGKYIPLRERKLLNRLVRTRAVYDDLRARLISDSTLSLEKNADLRPGRHQRVVTPLDSDKSGAILEIVDIIDKGAALDPKKLSECCSCCSCSSELKPVEHTKKERRGKRANARTYEEYGQSEQIGTGEGFYSRTHERKYGKTKRTGPGGGAYATYEREFIQTVPGRPRERYNKRGVRFKAKHIRSEPCTCTFKFSGLIKKHSKAMFKKIRPLPSEESHLDAEEQYIIEKSKKQTFRMKSIQKYKDLRDKLGQDMKKLNKSRANMQQNLQVRAKKSVEQVKQVKDKIKHNIESGVRKSVQAVKGLHPKAQAVEPVEYPEPETTFKIKKDSIVKFKDSQKKKEMLKDWECDLECEPEICVPEECFKIIKLRRLHKGHRQRDRKQLATYEMIRREVKTGGIPLSKSDSGVQAEQLAITSSTRIRKHKPMLRVEEKHQIIESREVKKGGKKKGVRKLAKNLEKSSVRTATHGEKSVRDIKKKGGDHGKHETLKAREGIEKKPHSRGRQAVRIKSSFSFDLEFYKNPRSAKKSRSSQPSGIHVHAPRHKRKKLHRHQESDVSSLESSLGTPDNIQTRLIQTDKYRKAPMTSQGRLASKISQCECDKRVSHVKTGTNYGTRSVSSSTNSVETTDKNMSKVVKQKGHLSQVSLLSPAPLDTLTPGINEINSNHKQAVRIGSTFSFNIEFYKNNNKNEIKPPPIKKKVKYISSKHRQVRRKLVQVKGTSTRAYNQAKTTLHRCFCTLKLQKKTKTSKTATCLCEKNAPAPPMIDKSVETKKINRFEPPKLYNLQPFECEPGICIPGECDPILCKKIIDMRKRRFKKKMNRSIGSYTGSRKTKSTSSIVSRPFTPARAKIVQSSIVPTKVGTTSAPKRYKNNLNLGRTEIIKTNFNTPGRQAVRIGSSFSFDIEFYKDIQSPTIPVEHEPSYSSGPPEINIKHRKIRKTDHNKRKSMLTQYIGPKLTHCLCKSYKKKVPKKQTPVRLTTLSVNTQTLGEPSIGESVDKGTGTKKKHHYKLLPHEFRECEPYFCVPGECDPYLCLQKIKRRELNHRNISAITDAPEMRSISSFTETSSNISEAILVQPKQFRKGTNMKADHFKTLNTEPRPAGDTFKASKSKQAVRIGSSFNFSIEFSKKLPGAVTLTKYPKIKQTPNVHPKQNRDKGITVTKVRVDHVDTQALEPRKVNRASFVRPMLKRCFCTLNLQKKTKQQNRKGKRDVKFFGPEAYAVGRVMTTNNAMISHSFRSQINAKLQLNEPKNKILSISTSSFLLNRYVKCLKSKYETINLHSTFKIPIELKEPVTIKSTLSMELDIRRLGTFEEITAPNIKQPLEKFSHAYIDEKYNECLKLFNEHSVQNLKKITGISRYLEQCFCTMNVHISNQGGIPGRTKIGHKLEPYECEPGICIPGECDPYECKKLIMKRYAKNKEKSSATNSMSVSSYATTNVGLGTRGTQMKRRVQTYSQVTVPRQFKRQRQRESKQRQAVRIKSSFSFDLEFYKHHSQPMDKIIKHDEVNTRKPVYQKRYETVGKGTRGMKFRDRDTFQTTVSLVHRGTGTIPKRCFCTLKLQKKGRIHRERAKLDIISAKQTPSITSRNVKIGTAFKHHEVPVVANDLKFYECEPGICVPGHCDPYKCLELMKHRKNLGINTIQRPRYSDSSMTSVETHKTRAVGAIPLRTHTKATKAIKHVKKLENYNPDIHTDRNSRSAVRIGSNFSFNIEFYKDKPQVQQNTDISLHKRQTSKNDLRKVKQKKTRKTNSIVSPSRSSISHKSTGTENTSNHDATMTASFMKRCFCTKNLRSIKAPDQRNTNTFKNKCLCLLGLRGKGKKENQTTEKLGLQVKEDKNNQIAVKPNIHRKGNMNYQFVDKHVQTAEKLKYTNVRQKLRLDPYECEPGICVPGECDPYMCEKLIQRRWAKQHTRHSGTETIRTQSVASSFGSYKRSKNERTQAHGQTYKKKIQHLSRDTSPSGQILSSDADKRLVRIGSSFSFNIEFYKENGNGNIIKDKIREIKTYPNKDFQHGKTAAGNVSKSIGTETVYVRRNKSQVKAKVQTTGVSPLLKRCFCTLKLLNKPVDQVYRTKVVSQFHTRPVVKQQPSTRSVETQSHKRLKVQTLQNNLNREALSPYECEPFVCVPGQCNPIECLKRIQRRQQHTKEFGTITKYPKNKSIGSVSARMRDENLQVRHLGTLPNKGVQKISHADKSGPQIPYQSRQAVRIGSNFSFNIEFFKDNGNYLPNVVSDGPSEKLNIQKYAKKVVQRHKKTEPAYFKNNAEAHVQSAILQSPETAKSHLKRCFCTLPLRNQKINKQENIPIRVQSDQPKSVHSNVGSFLKKCMCTLKLNKVGKQQNQPPTPTVKYEIKGTSTDTRRVPQNYIKPPVRLLEPYECEPYICVPGECDPYECLKRIQRRQVRNFGTEYKRFVKDSATDSIKRPGTKSTKAQYKQRQKLNSRGTSSVSKRPRRSKETAKFSHDQSNTNRQVVRIGSNFSFNIEFFKNTGGANSEYKDTTYLKPVNAPNIKTLQLKQPENSSTKSRGSISTVKRLRDKKSQFSGPKRQVKCPAANIAPKRCFCTLKLLKKPNKRRSELKLPPPPIPTEDKMTGTKIKYTVPQELGIYECPPHMCIPGECNPYECLEKIKRREIMRKSRQVGTRAVRTSIASVGNRGINLRAHRVQSQIAKRKHVITSTPYSEPQSEILRSSRIMDNSDRRNKRAVRIGSNFNFNVEFFKQKLEPTVIPGPKIVNAKHNGEDSKSHLNKHVTAGARNVRHLQTNDIKFKDQGSDAGNLLKRCFCTLQLQKPSPKMTGVKMHHPGNDVRYPQTFTVGRVAVEPHFNTTAKTDKLKKTDKARSTSIDPKLLNRTVATKTDKKYLRNENFSPSQCNPSNCPDYQKRILNDMHTILPFAPNKFNKNESRTCIASKKNNKVHNQLNGDVCNPNKTLIICKGKRRLTAKKSEKSIPPNSLHTNSNFKDSFFCRCVKFFSRKSEIRSEAPDKEENTSNINKRSKQARTRRQSEKLRLTVPPKKAKSFGENCPFICPENTKETGKRYSKLQSGDADSTVVKMPKKFKFNDNQPKSHGGGKFVTFADTSEHLKNNTIKKKKKSIHSKSSRSKLIYSCSVNNCPRKPNKLKVDQQSLHDYDITRKSIKSYKKAVSYSESADDCQYCASCKRKVDTDEISKGGGDRRLSILSKNRKHNDSCPCSKKSIIHDNERKRVDENTRADNVSGKFSMKTDKCCTKIKPVLEMRLDSTNHSIINVNEVRKKVKQLTDNNYPLEDIKSEQIKTKRPPCSCCKCLKRREKLVATKKQGATISIPAKGAKDILGNFKNPFPKKKIVLRNPLKPSKPIRGPCICGSKKCALELQKKRSGKLQIEKIGFSKSCICGSDICTAESKRMKRKHSVKLRKAKRKVQSISDKIEREAVKKRVKIQEKKDEIRRRERIKRNKELERRVRKYKGAGDVMLAIDSLTDIGRLGVTSAISAIRCTTKAAMDPKVACQLLCKKCRKKDPESAFKQFQKDYLESDTAATVRRLKIRCLFMNSVKSLRERLENNPITHFILHIADKNAKTRKFKRKPVRRIREPLDFQCSLYMATLRKRPYLSVYYKWPWFYPHFITMLNIWRQFTDIMLFLLAAVVWSPCILCMEGCRAMMCCFFCTG